MGPIGFIIQFHNSGPAEKREGFHNYPLPKGRGNYEPNRVAGGARSREEKTIGGNYGPCGVLRVVDTSCQGMGGSSNTQKGEGCL